MRKYVFSCIAAITMIVLPLMVFASGAHDGLACTGCHALHTAKETNLIFAVDQNKKDINARTKQPYGGITALCLGCHQAPEKGGQGIVPISGHMSHPYGLSTVNQKVARVSWQLLRDGKFECVSCHDPHPSNPNYKYLRIDTANGAKMEIFCAECHPMKADQKSAAARKQLFNSMDERFYGASASESAVPATPAPPATSMKKP